MENLIFITTKLYQFYYNKKIWSSLKVDIVNEKKKFLGYFVKIID